MAQAPTGLEITAKVFPLAFLLYLFKPTIELDGQPMTAKWGTQFVPAAPGNHTVFMYFNYMLFGKCNRATAQVSLAEGQILRVTYKTRWLVFLQGRIEVQPAAPTASAPA